MNGYSLFNSIMLIFLCVNYCFSTDIEIGTC